MLGWVPYKVHGRFLPQSLFPVQLASYLITSLLTRLVRLLASHQREEPGSIPDVLAPGFSHVGIVSDNVAGRPVFSGISRFPRLLRSGAVSLHHFGSEDLDYRSDALAPLHHYFIPPRVIVVKAWGSCCDLGFAPCAGRCIRIGGADLKKRTSRSAGCARTTRVVWRAALRLRLLAPRVPLRWTHGGSSTMVGGLRSIRGHSKSSRTTGEQKRTSSPPPLRVKGERLQARRRPRSNGAPLPRSRSEGAIRTTLTRTPSASLLLRARRAVNIMTIFHDEDFHDCFFRPSSHLAVETMLKRCMRRNTCKQKTSSMWGHGDRLCAASEIGLLIYGFALLLVGAHRQLLATSNVCRQGAVARGHLLEEAQLRHIALSSTPSAARGGAPFRAVTSANHVLSSSSPPPLPVFTLLLTGVVFSSSSLGGTSVCDDTGLACSFHLFNSGFKEFVDSPIYITVIDGWGKYERDQFCSHRANSRKTCNAYGTSWTPPAVVKLLLRGRGGLVVRLLVSHLREPGSIPSGVAPGFPHVKILPENVAGRRVFSGFSRFLRFHSGAVPYSPRFTLFHPHRFSRPRCQERPNLSSPLQPRNNTYGILIYFFFIIFVLKNGHICIARSSASHDTAPEAGKFARNCFLRKIREISVYQAGDNIVTRCLRRVPEFYDSPACQPHPSLLGTRIRRIPLRWSRLSLLFFYRSELSHSLIDSNSTSSPEAYRNIYSIALTIWKFQRTPSHAERTRSVIQIILQINVENTTMVNIMRRIRDYRVGSLSVTDKWPPAYRSRCRRYHITTLCPLFGSLARSGHRQRRGPATCNSINVVYGVRCCCGKSLDSHSRVPAFDSRTDHPDFGFLWLLEITPGECWMDIHGDSSPFILQPFHELSNGFWPRLTSLYPAIQFVPKMFYMVGARAGQSNRPQSPIELTNVSFSPEEQEMGEALVCCAKIEGGKFCGRTPLDLNHRSRWSRDVAGFSAEICIY
ncbi:hypothetical protein PR048_025085 [Dryococelus australis]|uniref:Uncharacterized protein n=1 Tax=Dryococelus australis TaxID=614101 RepID=A0ABQ9GQC9_9NEOP|nr:hypothetical protein PR048_025085 [Dryococelus australis]